MSGTSIIAQFSMPLRVRQNHVFIDYKVPFCK